MGTKRAGDDSIIRSINVSNHRKIAILETHKAVTTQQTENKIGYT